LAQSKNDHLKLEVNVDAELTEDFASWLVTYPAEIMAADGACTYSNIVTHRRLKWGQAHQNGFLYENRGIKSCDYRARECLSP
jgi:hypothetical protein